MITSVLLLLFLPPVSAMKLSPPPPIRKISSILESHQEEATLIVSSLTLNEKGL
jgi:hypothetical protein